MRNREWPIHYLVSSSVFIAGLLNVLTSLSLHHIPHIRVFEGIIPIFFIHTARTFTLLIGIFLILLSLNLFRRKRRAWIFSTIFIICSIFLHFLRGFNVIEILFLIFLLIILLITRHAFEVESDKHGILKAIGRFILVMTFLFIYAIFGFYLFQGQFSHIVNLHNIFADYIYTITGVGQEVLIAQTRNAMWFADSISVVSITMFIYSISLLFQPLIENNKATPEEKQKVRELILRYGKNPISFFSLMEDKQYFFNENRDCIIAYKIQNGIAVALGDPIGPSNEIMTQCAQAFIKDNHRKGIKTVFYNAQHDTSEIYDSLGYKSIKIGEEALLQTETFTLTGSAMANVRHEVNNINRNHGIATWYRMDQIPWRYVNEINNMHASWLSFKKSPQLTFSLDYFPFPVEEQAYVLLITSPHDMLWGALSFFPYGTQGMSLDFMIRSVNSPRGIIEAGIFEATNYFRTKGITTISLGMAPLSDITIQADPKISEQIKNLIFERLNQFYNYKTLFKFKSKFNPVWLHKYLIYKNEYDLPTIMIAIAQAHLSKPFRLF